LKILQPDYILTPDRLIKGVAVAFDAKIRKIAPVEELRRDYPEAPVIEGGEHSLVMPGLINPHVHLEFSANKTTLTYGGFLPWLHSVIANRDTLVAECSQNCMQHAVSQMLESGITTFGAVSSYGMDLDTAAAAPQNVVFFNELIGSQAAMADALYGDFMQRLEASASVERPGFYPAVAVHSPYSVHPVLIRRALELARMRGLRLSAHFMESRAEREWLDANEGEFKSFFTDFLKQSVAVNTAAEFLSLFEERPTLMTHVVHATGPELDLLAAGGHTVIHCPISNRLLGNGAIDLDALERHGVRWVLGTDGLSSNYRLDLFEEMKIALFMHSDAPLLPLARRLLRSATVEAAKALNLDTGEIAEGKDADMLLLRLRGEPDEQLSLHLLLQGYPVERVFIRGKAAFERIVTIKE